MNSSEGFRVWSGLWYRSLVGKYQCSGGTRCLHFHESVLSEESVQLYMQFEGRWLLRPMEGEEKPSSGKQKWRTEKQPFSGLQYCFSSQTSVSAYKITRCHNPDDHNLNNHLCKNCKTYNFEGYQRK